MEQSKSSRKHVKKIFKNATNYKERFDEKMMVQSMQIEFLSFRTTEKNISSFHYLSLFHEKVQVGRYFFLRGSEYLLLNSYCLAY